MRKKLFLTTALFFLPICTPFVVLKIFTFLKKFLYQDLSYLATGLSFWFIILIIAFFLTCKYLNRLIYHDFKLLNFSKFLASFGILISSIMFIRNGLTKMYGKILNIPNYFMKKATYFFHHAL
jgi:cytochrome b561